MWGVTIGTAVLQTQLSHRLPSDFVTSIPGGGNAALAYSLIPVIPTLEDPFRAQVQDAYAKSIAVIWQVMIGVAGIGFLASLFMKGLPLHTQTDKQWGLQEGKKGAESGESGKVEEEKEKKVEDGDVESQREGVVGSESA